jgi:cyclopropane-fatty-acyl-phospholipid synthase
MKPIAAALYEHLPLPDFVVRNEIGTVVNRESRRLQKNAAGAEAAFAAAMAEQSTEERGGVADAQWSALPAEFFGHIYGPRRKGSCCLYEKATDLAGAEERALAQTCLHAEIADGQKILELGCGWGSLSLWIAERYAGCTILAVAGSQAQRDHVRAEAARRSLGNLTVADADPHAFDTEERFDRIVAVEQLEHMANWSRLFQRIHRWISYGGRVFVHMFSHRNVPYKLAGAEGGDWITRHFLGDAIMPSNGLIGLATPDFVIEAAWRWSGENYRRTADDWLTNFDRNAAAIRPILQQVYGRSAAVWRRRWRLFFMATAALFGARGGEEWGIRHYRLRPR